jgi:hypothetical protein
VQTDDIDEGLTKTVTLLDKLRLAIVLAVTWLERFRRRAKSAKPRSPRQRISTVVAFRTACTSAR